jgi:hypothetical protein
MENQQFTTTMLFMSKMFDYCFGNIDNIDDINAFEEWIINEPPSTANLWVEYHKMTFIYMNDIIKISEGRRSRPELQNVGRHHMMMLARSANLFAELFDKNIM